MPSKVVTWFGRTPIRGYREDGQMMVSASDLCRASGLSVGNVQHLWQLGLASVRYATFDDRRQVVLAAGDAIRWLEGRRSSRAMSVARRLSDKTGGGNETSRKNAGSRAKGPIAATS
ncbi:MAG: hypothetical protein ACM3ZE_31780 [Myxococcales bacterium]